MGPLSRAFLIGTLNNIKNKPNNNFIKTLPITWEESFDSNTNLWGFVKLHLLKKRSPRPEIFCAMSHSLA